MYIVHVKFFFSFCRFFSSLFYALSIFALTGTSHFPARSFCCGLFNGAVQLVHIRCPQRISRRHTDNAACAVAVYRYLQSATTCRRRAVPVHICIRCTNATLGDVCLIEVTVDKQTKQTPWPLVRKRTIPTERPTLVDEI
jgi:hypothetical protein